MNIKKIAIAFTVLTEGTGKGLWAYGAAFTEEGITWNGLGNAALDVFLVTSAIVFVAAGVNYLTEIVRSRKVSSAQLASNKKQFGFISEEKLNQHFAKHNKDFEFMYANAQEYLDGANYVINNGIYVKEMNGYLRYYAVIEKEASYAFVGLTGDGNYITTYGIRRISSLKQVPWIIR